MIGHGAWGCCRRCAACAGCAAAALSRRRFGAVALQWAQLRLFSSQVGLCLSPPSQSRKEEERWRRYAELYLNNTGKHATLCCLTLGAGPSTCPALCTQTVAVRLHDVHSCAEPDMCQPPAFYIMAP